MASTHWSATVARGPTPLTSTLRAQGLLDRCVARPDDAPRPSTMADKGALSNCHNTPKAPTADSDVSPRQFGDLSFAWDLRHRRRHLQVPMRRLPRIRRHGSNVPRHLAKPPRPANHPVSISCSSMAGGGSSRVLSLRSAFDHRMTNAPSTISAPFVMRYTRTRTTTELGNLNRTLSPETERRYLATPHTYGLCNAIKVSQI